MSELSLVSSIITLFKNAKEKNSEKKEDPHNIASFIYEQLYKNPGHRREGRPLTHQDIQEIGSLLPQEEQRMRDVYIQHFSQEYWAARVMQSVLAIKHYEDQNSNRRDTFRLPYHLMAELRNSVMGFYMREFMIVREEKLKSEFELYYIANDKFLDYAVREFRSIVDALWRVFSIQTPIILSQEGNDSHLIIFKQELSSMIDMHGAFRKIPGVTDVIVQPANGIEDAHGKVDCYVLVEYGNRGYEQYAIQIKRRRYHRFEYDDIDIYKLAGTGQEINLSDFDSGLYYREKGAKDWYYRLFKNEGLTEERRCPPNFLDFLESVIHQRDSDHGDNSPYFLLPHNVDPYADVQYYTAFWFSFHPSGGFMGRRL